MTKKQLTNKILNYQYLPSIYKQSLGKGNIFAVSLFYWMAITYLLGAINIIWKLFSIIIAIAIVYCVERPPTGNPYAKPYAELEKEQKLIILFLFSKKFRNDILYALLFIGFSLIPTMFFSIELWGKGESLISIILIGIFVSAFYIWFALKIIRARILKYKYISIITNELPQEENDEIIKRINEENRKEIPLFENDVVKNKVDIDRINSIFNYNIFGFIKKKKNERKKR